LRPWPSSALCAVEREIKDDRDKLSDPLTDAEVERTKRTRAGPVLATFADWREQKQRAALPKRFFF
jgi:transposase